MLLLQLGYKEPSSSKENDFTAAAGSAAGHLPSPLADRCYAVSQLQSAIEFPSVQRFQQSPHEVSPLHPPMGAMVADCGCGEPSWNRC